MSTTMTMPTASPSFGTSHPSSVRLTRRGRLVVLAAALITVLAVGFFLASGSVATDEPGTPEPTRVVLVGSGDDDGDVRSMIDRISELNALDSGMVVAGQRLVVPVD
jgi:hypothetical protein